MRKSRAVGLPAPAPDIFGLAIRVPTGGGGHGDLLFASTGLGRLTRFTLTAAWMLYGRPLTTLLPYRTLAFGPVLLSAVFRDERTVALAWAVRAGTWHPFAELSLDEDPVDEAGDRARRPGRGSGSPAGGSTPGYDGSESPRTPPRGAPVGPEPLRATAHALPPCCGLHVIAACSGRSMAG